MNSWLQAWRSGTALINTTAGILLMLALTMALLARSGIGLSGWQAGIPLWLAMLMLAPQIKTAQQKQIGVLLVIGLCGLLFATSRGVDGRYWLKALEANQLLVGMLIGVSFLRLVALAGIGAQEQLPRGPAGLQKTLFGTHLFASVLNISAVLIVGDRLSHAASNQPLKPVQGMVLLRAFSACAFWSPFFAAMGLTLLSAPGARLGTLVLYGLPLALVALLFTARELKRWPDAADTMAYPMQWSALWMPLLLAVLVIIAHLIWPQAAVLTLVTLIALGFALGWLTLIRRSEGIKEAIRHVRSGLPNLCSEIALFLGAAVLAAGVAATLDALSVSLAPQHFGAFEACVTLAALIGVAVAGMHPVTSVALAGSLIGGSVTDPDLLGLTLLMGWALGVGLSPLSGIQLTLQARFGMSARLMLKANRDYALLMYPLCCLVLYLHQWLAAH